MSTRPKAFSWPHNLNVACACHALIALLLLLFSCSLLKTLSLLSIGEVRGVVDLSGVLEDLTSLAVGQRAPAAKHNRNSETAEHTKQCSWEPSEATIQLYMQ